MARGLAAGRWTSVQLTEHFLERIRADRSIHAVCTPEPERARRDAVASDARRARGTTLGLLDGLPLTLKDAVRVEGSITTWGMLPLRRHVPSRSSRAVDVVLRQGAVLLGRTTVPTASFDWNGVNGVHPRCVHPLDPERVPGGSSAGAAAAVAAGLSPLDVGSDVAGSVRVPCGWCGVAGLRTTDGWVPIDDIGPEFAATGLAHVATLGPIAAEVADLELVLDVWREAFPIIEQPMADGPLAMTWSLLEQTVDARTRAAIEAWLAPQAHVIEASPDIDWEDAFRDWGMIVGHELGRGLPGPARSLPVRWAYGALALRWRLGGGRLTRSLLAGLTAPISSYEAALERMERVRQVVDDFLRRHRAWVLPVASTAALRHAECGRVVDGMPYGDRLGAWQCPTALLGTPALTIPLPVEGLPIGVQVHGPRFADRALVRAFGAASPSLRGPI